MENEKQTAGGIAMPPFDMGRVREKSSLAESTPCGACPVRTLTVCAALEADELRRLACRCNDTVRRHFDEVLKGVYPSDDEPRDGSAGPLRPI